MNKKVCVVGLGYVGLPLANLCCNKGLDVFGYDIDKEKVGQINKRISPIKGIKISDKLKATNDASVMQQCDVIIICVQTPVKENNIPDLKPLTSAVETTSKNMGLNQLVIVESTINPGVCEEMLLPILEKYGIEEGKDFYLAHCPERIDPGNKKWNVSNIPRVVGGVSQKSAEKAAEFYKSILDADVKILSSIKAAESVKIVENTFRDVNIAFVNELAKSFDKLGIDAVEVIEGASTKPFSFMAHYPGCGVGGHCIPIDPYYLIEKAGRGGFNHEFLKLAREINNSMPNYTVNLVTEALNLVGMPVKNTKILVLGLAYKKDIDDLRHSPSFKIIEELTKLGATVKKHDPFVESDYRDINNAAKGQTCIVVATDHTEFKEKLTADFLKKNGIKAVVDGKNCLDKKKIEQQGIIYKGIGR